MNQELSLLNTIQEYTEILKSSILGMNNNSWINFNSEYTIIIALNRNIKNCIHLSSEQLLLKSFTLLNVAHRLLHIANRKQVLFFNDTPTRRPYMDELEFLLAIEHKIVLLIQVVKEYHDLKV